MGIIIPGKNNYGQRKPKQYGPSAYVRSCVMRNAEKFGIDPAFLQTILACWEGGGQVLHNYGLSIDFNNTGVTWDKKNPVFVTDTSYSASSASLPGLKTEFTCFVGGLATYYTGNQQRNFFSKPAITAYRFYFAFQYYATGKLVFTGANYKSVIGTKTHAAGKIITATVTRDNASTLYLYNNGELDGSTTGATGSIYDSLEYVGKPSSSYGIDGPLGVIYLLNGCCLNPTQIAELSERPYLLLVENRAPLIFDLAASGEPSIISITDTGSGVDALNQLLVSCGVTDVGSGAESFSPSVYAPVPDSGQGVDVISVLQELFKLITDSGTGADSLSSTAQLQIIDQAVGSELLLLSVVLQLLESAAGVDNVVVSALLQIVESGQGLDLVSLQTLLQIVDSGAGVDSVNVLAAVLKTITDSGTGLDSVQNILASCTITESGIGSDQVTLFVDLSITDTGSGLDVVSTLQQTLIQVLDSAIGSDQILPIVARIPISDQGQGVDAIQALRVALSIIEYAQGLDVIHVDMGLNINQIVLRFSSRQPRMSFSSKQPRISITEGDGE